MGKPLVYWPLVVVAWLAVIGGAFAVITGFPGEPWEPSYILGRSSPPYKAPVSPLQIPFGLASILSGLMIGGLAVIINRADQAVTLLGQLAAPPRPADAPASLPAEAQQQPDASVIGTMKAGIDYLFDKKD